MIDCVEKLLSQATQDRYRGIVKHHLIPNLGHIELKRLSPSHVQTLQNNLLASGMDPAGVNLVCSVLSEAMKPALNLEMIVRDPVSAAKAPNVPGREVQPPPLEAVIQMLELAEENGRDYWLYPALHLLVCTGIRRGELLALRWNAVDFEKSETRITSSAPSFANSGPELARVPAPTCCATRGGK